MGQKSIYHTKQRDKIIRVLQSSGGHTTASDICRCFREDGEPVSQATVYRQLEKLVDEGFVNKYTIDPNSPACFEFMDDQSHTTDGPCFHCKCEKCGRLIHLHCDELKEIQQHLYREHHFKPDPFRTVFYGICEDCQNAEKEAGVEA